MFSKTGSRIWALALAVGALVSGCGTFPSPASAGEESGADGPRKFTLAPSAVWQVDLPGGARFDASGLSVCKDGALITLSDQTPAIYRLVAPPGGGVAHLDRLSGFFAANQLAPFAAEKKDRYDIEGVTLDAEGNVYVCEEANRWILRFPADGSKMERLPIDWSSVARWFDPKDDNASFEGVAVIGRTLFVANERNLPRIIRVDLDTMKVVGDFCPTYNVPLVNEAHFGDLSAWRGHLFVLVRSRRQILEVDPDSERVLAEYNVDFVERDPDYAYITRYGTGNLEGLAIDAGGFWLVTDNNGLGRKRYPQDKRPTLFRCPWPAGKEPTAGR